MIAIVDYGLGNLFSLAGALRHIGCPHFITGDPAKLDEADAIILPGVGAFGDAVERLAAGGLGAKVVQRARRGVPLMGICLGMQLLFDRSFEFGERAGLGLIPGEVRLIEAGVKVPHIGWNSLHIVRPGALTKRLKEGEFAYYVHSYYATSCDESIVATSEYGVAVPGIVERGNVCGTQFHPERSGETGLNMLRSFAEETL